MQKIIITFLLLLILCNPKESKAWGPEGHAIIAKLAMHYVKDDVRKNVLAILGTMSVDTAANWMDIMRSNADYDFMKPWHYVDFPKGKEYEASNEENIVNRLVYTYRELEHKNTLCSEQVRIDLMVLLHLMGDLHMPLHAGYDEDLGGNKITIQFDTLKTHNLHKFWDEDIIMLTNITYEQLVEQSSFEQGGEIDFLKWMNESRSLLDNVYDFPGFILSENYLSKSKLIVQQQLIVAAKRLANLLNRLFNSPAELLDFKKITSQYKNGIAVIDAIQNIGKKVTICSTVYGIKSAEKITQMNIGGKFPNSPLTIIIFASSYGNFPTPPAETYKDKNVCVTGRLEEYKGKAQIVVDSASDLIIL